MIETRRSLDEVGEVVRERESRDTKDTKELWHRDVNWYIERHCYRRERGGNEGILGEGSPLPTRLL
ncbi:hypothetical protein BDM02DRAFT_3110710, partial [Thelephora ganbajun]